MEVQVPSSTAWNYFGLQNKLIKDRQKAMMDTGVSIFIYSVLFLCV